MTAAPTQRQRAAFVPNLEMLEDRCVPAIGVNTFARFTSETVVDPTSVVIQVSTATFKLLQGRVGIALNLRASAGSSLDPAAVSIQNVSGALPKTFLSRDDRSMEPTSLTLVNLGQGSVRVVLPAAAVGNRWTLEASLIGDADGNFVVNAFDLVLVGSLIGKQRGQVGFQRQADFDGDGRITLADRNLVRGFLGTASFVRPISVVASLAAASDGDGNRIVLTSSVIVAGQTRPGATVRLDIGNDGVFEKQVFATATGKFGFPITIAPGTTDYRVVATDRFGQRAGIDNDVTLGDVILDWNAVHQTAIRDFTVFSQVPYSNRIVFTAPPLAARNLAMVHAAMYDAVTIASGVGDPYHANILRLVDTSATAASAAAAHRILVALYPKAEQIALFNAALVESLAAVPNGPAENAGIVLGRSVADAYLAWRSTDGARTVKPYTPGTVPGEWRFTPPDFLPALVPQFADVTPFVIPTSASFRPAAPPALTSAEYATAFNEVKELGRFNSTTRTAAQTEIALFWADGPGTYTPPGHWNEIASIVALQKGNTLAENARLFAVLNLAIADAGIACWDAKYAYNFWRPITAIREADLDGNDLTEADPTWAPLLKTPNFPTYTSGHSTFSGAAATVLAAFFGDDVSFTMESDGHEGFTERPLASTITRSFTSFSQAALEAAKSREYGGIHFSFDDNVGYDAGIAIGAYVAANWLPLSEE